MRLLSIRYPRNAVTQNAGCLLTEYRSAFRVYAVSDRDNRIEAVVLDYLRAINEKVQY